MSETEDNKEDSAKIRLLKLDSMASGAANAFAGGLGVAVGNALVEGLKSKEEKPDITDIIAERLTDIT